MLKYRNYFPLIVYMTVSFSKSYFYLIFASHEQKLFASTPKYTAMPVMELMKLKKSLISDQWGYEKKIVPKDEVGARRIMLLLITILIFYFHYSKLLYSEASKLLYLN